MRISPVCQYISTQLNTTVSLYSYDSVLLHQYLASENLPPVITDKPDHISFLLQTAESEYPVITFINGGISYAHFKSPDGIYIIGPFHLLYSEENMHARHTLEVESIDQKFKTELPGVYPHNAAKYVLLLFNTFQQEDLAESEYFRKNFYTEFIREEANEQTISSIFSNRENNKMHNSYNQEIRFLQCIEDGNIQNLRKTWEEPATGNLGMTSIDPVRNGKNMAIYNVTASGRAAIRGGLPAEYVFSLTDSYTQQIEGLKNMLILHSLVQDAQINFTQMVADLKNRSKKVAKVEHPLIHQSKNYVFQHLHNRLTVQEVAGALHVHPNFLSSLFQEQEGISLYQYILAQKIDLTKNLLTYSNYSYIDIANYLGFNSQSHLGARFKACTGMTLKQYRDTNKVEEFYK